MLLLAGFLAHAEVPDAGLEAYSRGIVEEVFREAGVTNVPGIIPACFRRADLLDRLDFPLQPSGFLKAAVWVRLQRREELRRLPTESWRLKVAYVPGVLDGLDQLKVVAAEKGVEIDAVPYEREEDVRQAVLRGTVDGQLLVARQAPRDLVQLLDVGFLPYFFAVPVGDPAFPALDRAMTRLKVYGQDRIDELSIRHLHVEPSKDRIRLALPMRAGLVEEQADGQVRGALVEIIVRMADFDSWHLDGIRCRSLEEAKEYVRLGLADVLCGVQLTEDDQLLCSHVSLGYIRNYLVARSDAPMVKGDAGSWKDARVAVLKGLAEPAQVLQAFRDYGISAELVPCDTEAEAWTALEADRCNLVLTTDGGETERRKVVYAMAPLPYYFCTALSRRDVLRRFDDVSIRMLRGDPTLPHKLSHKYFATPRGFACLPSIREKEIIAQMEASGEVLDLAIDGISALPSGVSGIDRVNRLFEDILTRNIYERIGIRVRFTHDACSPTDPCSYVWKLDHLWLNGGSSGGRETIRINLRFGSDFERVALVRKVLSSISDEEMQNLLYMAVTEGQDRPYVTREQLFNILAGVLLLALVYTLYAYRRIREALGRAEHAARAKTQFLATISHEIRTPLNAIIGFSEHLEGKDGATSVKDCVRGIRKSSDALLALINDVLDITKLESGSVDLRSGVCNLGKIIAEGSFIFGERARMKGLAFNVSVPDQLPDFKLFGPAVRQVLTNIVGNAFKYTDRGSINCALRLVPAGEGRLTIVIRISDTGCGISEEGQKTVFDPFSRDIAGHAGRVYEGTGLGLPIVKRLVDAMKGTVRISSRLGEWTTVTICLPAVEMAAPEHPWRQTPSPEKSPATAESAFAGLRVMVVDDIAMNLKIMKLHLERAGVKSVSTFEDPETAFFELKVLPPDLLLTDMWMPGLNGEELARRCRESGRLRDLRIVAVSADTDSDATFDMSVFDAVMPKPVTLEHVRTCLAETLAAKQARG